MDNEQKTSEARQYWDNAAINFDAEPDHGLKNDAVRMAWRNRLMAWLPSTKASVLDLGCGTGSLSVLIAQLGHEVTGIDFSPVMIAHAQTKAAAHQLQIQFKIMDAALPQFDQQFDVIVCRHLLWALSSPKQVLKHWSTLLTPIGRLILIEGYWHTGGGLHAQEIMASLPTCMHNHKLYELSSQSALWGGEVIDERYAIVSMHEKYIRQNK